MMSRGRFNRMGPYIRRCNRSLEKIVAVFGIIKDEVSNTCSQSPVVSM